MRRDDGQFAVTLVGFAKQRRSKNPRQPLLPRAPEVLHGDVRPPWQVRRKLRPLVPQLRLQVDHDPFFLRRELAPAARRTN